MKLEVTPHDMTGHRLLRYSPLLSGLLQFVFCSWYRQHSFRLAAESGTIICAQHLYRALAIHQQDEATQWPDMELVQKIMSSDKFYTGGAVPKSFDQSWTLLSLQLGVSPTAFALDLRRTTKIFSKAGPRCLRPPADVLTLFEERYVKLQGQLRPLDMIHVERIVRQSRYTLREVQDPHFPSIPVLMKVPILDEDTLRDKAREAVMFFGDGDAASKLKRQAVSSTKPTTQPEIRLSVTSDGVGDSLSALLTELILSTEAESAEYNFPFLPMYRQCFMLLRSVQDNCVSTLGAVFSSYEPISSNKTSIVLREERKLMVTVLHILMAATTRHTLGVSFRRPLDLAADALHEFLLTGQGREIRDKYLHQDCVEMLQRWRMPGWDRKSAPTASE